MHDIAVWVELGGIVLRRREVGGGYKTADTSLHVILTEVTSYISTPRACELISHNVLIEWLLYSQLPRTPVNLIV